MKALSRRSSGKIKLTTLEVLFVVIIVVIVVIAGVIARLVNHNHHSSTAKPKSVAVTFDVSTIALIGPNCSYPTPLGCFIPTDSQASTLNKLNTQGYAMAHVVGQGYTNYQLVPGTVPHAPVKKTKALHVTSVTSIKSTGQKQK
jgi:hypothetical protein